MHKPRHRARVARVLSHGKSHGTRWKQFNVCVIAGSFLLLASLAFLQLRLAISGPRPSSDELDESDRLSVNYIHSGRSWRGKLWQGGSGGEEKGQRTERKLGSRGSGSVGDLGGDKINSGKVPSEDEDDATEEDEGDRFEELENEMDMEDEEGDNFASFGGDAGGWNHDRELQEEKKENSSGSRQGKVTGLPLLQEKVVASGVESQAFSIADDSTGAFSTDDEPLDDETRDRVEHMSNMEDVLMLNRADSSAKKGSWGRIQDEMLAKKEKGAKLSSDPLNPENNPLLQDPDSMGQGGGLSKNDRALLKAFKWVDENEHLDGGSPKKPDVRVQDDLKKGTRNQSFGPSISDHNKLAGRVRVLDIGKRMNKSEEQGSLKGESDLSQSRQSKGEASTETPSAIPKRRELQRTRKKKKDSKKARKMSSKGDMRGWGYGPGFHSELTFSNFMEEFLFDEKCSVRVFMAWVTPPWAFTVRHQRVLESLLYFHPSACVVVFSDTLELEFFESFVEEGYRIATVMPALEELLRDTPTDVFAAILPDWRNVDLFYIHYTELLRLGALYKYGGIYLDFDMIVLKPLTELSNTIGSELLEDGQVGPNGAIMVFDKFSPFLNRSMMEFTATYDETLRDWNGAALLDRVMKAPSDGHDVVLATEDKPHVEPPVSFFPLSSQSIYRYFKAPEEDVAIAEEGELLERILLQSYAVHLWNGLTFKLIPEPGSLIDKLMGRHCLHCTDIL